VERYVQIEHSLELLNDEIRLTCTTVLMEVHSIALPLWQCIVHFPIQSIAVVCLRLMLSRLGKSSRMKSESQKSLMKLDLTRLHADSDLEVARSRLESTKSSFFLKKIQIFITTVL
jgi:hypothetical protein